MVIGMSFTRAIHNYMNDGNRLKGYHHNNMFFSL